MTTCCLKERRMKAGLTQAELSKIAGISRYTVSRIERGAYSPSITLAMKLADICQSGVEEIFPRT
ncbi:helix-turn-helix transcriptional regulator [Blautia schinkii]|nr:helix-turn-helix transcriptional regulator [Blautia schinkii]